jgi:hypothetical protein
MPDTTPPWQALFDRVRVVRDGGWVYAPPVTVTDAELDGLEAEIGSRLPASYRAWMKRFGACELKNWVGLACVVGRSGGTVLDDTRILREFSVDLAEYYPNHAWLSTLICFGGSGGGDLYAWDPADITQEKPREYRFHFLNRNEGFAPVAAGGSFWQFLEWAEADMASWRCGEGEEPGLTFTPARIRAKKKPLKREVRPWLTWNGGTVRNLAIALRADPRPDEFPVLADALRDAGCDNADLLASCAREAHDEDRAWMLKVLLG